MGRDNCTRIKAMATIKELRDVRIEKLNKLKELGINPYPATADRTHTNAEVVENYKKLKGKKASLVGRLVSLREHGALFFADLRDESGDIQLYVQQENLEETSKENQNLGFEHLGLLNTGDFVQADGKITETKSGQISLQPTRITLLSKSIRPYPDEHTGIKNVEELYRKRYLDFMINPESKKIIDARWTIEKEIRKFLWDKGFNEVETPVLQALYGGTNAKPFKTFFNALGADFYLRIAPELYLKRLIVGGYEKVFEIARNFRNEGIDQSHFPEFTMLEWYEAYADYHRVMDLAEELTKHLVKELTGGTKIMVGENEIDIGGEWPRVPVEDLIKEHLGVVWDDATDEEVKALLEKHHIKTQGTWDLDKALFTLFEHLISPKLMNPMWVIDYPQAVSPLSKAHRSKDRRAERFEGYIGGVEVFDGWSEIVSGLEQRSRFENEQSNMKAGDEEAMPLDEDFLETLEYGCPPLGGIGFGIDRMVMFLTNVWAIKQVVAFPILKPEVTAESNEKEPVMGTVEVSDDISGLPTRKEAEELLEEKVGEDYQKLHARMIAAGLEAYAEKYGEDKDLWWITGLVHDIDYFEFPDEHPHRSMEWFAEWGYPEQLQHAVAAHAWKWSNVMPSTKLAAALIYAYSLMRPTGWEGMKAKSIKKKFKDKSFAAKIDREEIMFGIEKLGEDFTEHITFLIEVFQKMDIK